MRESMHERFPLMTLELSEEVVHRVKSRAAVTALMDGRKPHRTRKELVVLAGKVRG